jgi:hypothetical protein
VNWIEECGAAKNFELFFLLVYFVCEKALNRKKNIGHFTLSSSIQKFSINRLECKRKSPKFPKNTPKPIVPIDGFDDCGRLIDERNGKKTSFAH